MRTIRTVAPIVVAGMLTMGVATTHGAATASDDLEALLPLNGIVDIVADRYLVVAEHGAALPPMAERIEAAGMRVDAFHPEVGLIVVETAEDGREELRGLPGVGAVVPDLRVEQQHLRSRIPSVDNPPSTGDDDERMDLQWGLDAVDAPEAWATGTRGAGALIAIIDDGIDASHPDLVDNVRRDLSVSVVPGRAWDDPASSLHGTAVASIAAAADNGVGIVGVAPEAQLVAVKATVEPEQQAVIDAATQISWVIDAMLYAASIGADAINLSLGILIPAKGGCDVATGLFCFDAADVRAVTALLRRVMQFVWSQGSVVVVAAGNQGVDRDEHRGLVRLPADANLALSVAATSPRGWGVDASTDLDVSASYTNTGVPEIDLSAPGGDLDPVLLSNPGQTCTVGDFLRPCFFFDAVHVAYPNGRWAWDLGTSFAAPHVAGVIGLVAGQHPEFDAAQLWSTVINSATDLGPAGRDAHHGHGGANAYNAVS